MIKRSEGSSSVWLATVFLMAFVEFTVFIFGKPQDFIGLDLLLLNRNEMSLKQRHVHLALQIAEWF